MLLELFYTSDIHGYLLPTDYRDKIPKPMGLWAVINSFKKGENTLVIDGGDTIQGSALIQYLIKNNLSADPVADLMRRAAYDYYIVGNHDFNYGEDYLRHFIRQTGATPLAANLTDKHPESPFLPWEIREMPSGLKLAIVGVTNYYINIWENPSHLENFIIDKAYEALERTIPTLPEHDFLLVVYHGGFENNLETGELLQDTLENEAYRMAENLPIDLLLTAHQHRAINADINGTKVVQLLANATQYAHIKVSKNKHISVELKTPEMPDPDQLLQSLVKLDEEVQAWLDLPIGSLASPLNIKDPLTMVLEGSALANFFNQVQLSVSGADISVASLPNEPVSLPKDVTMRHLLIAYAYNNSLVVKELTYEQLRLAMEKTASFLTYRNGEIDFFDTIYNPKLAYYNYDYYSGVHYTWDIRRPIGQRVVSIKYKGRELKPGDRLTIAMNNYRAQGGGEYTSYRTAPVIKDTGKDIIELMAEYIRENPGLEADNEQYMTLILG